MRARCLAAVTTMAILVGGCGEPKVDGSSDKAMKDSIQKIAGGLDQAGKAKFEDDVATVAFSKIDISGVLNGSSTQEQQLEKARQDLDGKSAKEISEAAEKIRIERQAREKDQAAKEIKDLEAKQSKAQSDKAELSKFQILKSRFSLRDEEYSYRKQPIIELSVKNGTSLAVSRAYFKGTIASPGRSIPWFSDTFNYQISGGLEPGESASWSLVPNMFGDWGKVNAPKDAVFTVEVYRIDGPDGEPLYSSEGLTKSQAERLDSLRKKFPQ